jgi:hypothetical protein
LKRLEAATSDGFLGSARGKNNQIFTKIEFKRHRTSIRSEKGCRQDRINKQPAKTKGENN